MGANETIEPRGTGPVRTASAATLVIEGEELAAEFIRRLDCGTAHPDELAVILGVLRGELLQGFCRVVQKTLERRDG